MRLRIERYLVAAAVIPLFASFAWSETKAARSSGQLSSTSQSPTPALRPQLTDEQRADIFMAHKEYADAIDYYGRALRQPESPKAVLWNKIGIARQQMGDLSGAQRAYKESIHLQKNFAAAWNNLGTTFYLKNKLKNSIKFYRRAVHLNPHDPTFHVNLGTSYYARRQYKKTVQEYRIALTLDPNVLVEHSNLASVVQARRADAEYYFYLAKVFASLGRDREAVRYLEHAMEDGFQDYRRINNDPDLRKLKNFPPFVVLMKYPPKPIPK